MGYPEINEFDDILGAKDGIRYELAEEKHWKSILTLLREHYVPDEVLCKALGSTLDIADSLMIYITRVLEESSSLCIVAVNDETEEVAGVRLTEIEHRDAEKVDNDQFDIGENPIKIIRLLDELHDSVNLFDKFAVDEILSFVMVSIHRGYRKRGLAKELFLRSMRLGKLRNITVVQGIFNSLYSQKAATSLGFECQQEYFYDEYEQDGKVVFRNTDPHMSVKFMARRI